MTSVGAHAVSTGRLDENVTDYAGNRMRRVASDDGGDDIVADVREGSIGLRWSTPHESGSQLRQSTSVDRRDGGL